MKHKKKDKISIELGKPKARMHLKSHVVVSKIHRDRTKFKRDKTKINPNSLDEFMDD